MCGITSIINYADGPPISAALISRMTELLSHRGPDASGIYISEERRLGLGNARLSILDPARSGNQPMQKHGLVVSFNGELFNFAEVRSELTKAGYTFTTGTDTEVLLSAFDRWGILGIQKFNGFFSFVLYNTATGEVFVVRDRLGVKPLVYADTGKALVVASEAKALLQHPDIRLEPNLQTITCDLVFNFWGDKQETYFRGIHYLEPGHYLRIAEGRVEKNRYWSMPSLDEMAWRPEDEIIEELYSLLYDAVRLRLIADCEIGSILSGGLDSSLITNMAATHSSYPLKCFTLQYGEQEDYDLQMARLLTNSYPNMSHLTVKIALEDVQTDVIDHVTYHMEEVLLDKAYYAIYRNYQSAHQAGLKVVLNGQGSDEAWLGYYHVYPFIRQFQAGLTPGAFAEYWKRNFTLHRFMDPQWVNEVVASHIDKNLDMDRVKHASPLDAIVTFAIRTHLQSMLVQEDRLSMSNNVECRVPFLDYRVISLALRTPAALKVLDGREKYLLRQVGSRILPEPIYTRPKVILPDLPDHFGEIADRLLEQGLPQKSDLVRELMDLSALHDLDALPAVDRWKIFTLWRFESVFFR